MIFKKDCFGGFVMRENFSCEDSIKRGHTEHTTCILTKGYTITIPKLVREKLIFISGDEVTISMKSNLLIIQKPYSDTLENKIVFNDRGSIKIPQEFIKLLSLEKGDCFVSPN